MPAQSDQRERDVEEFFHHLTPQELRDRFGLPGGSTVDWLLERLAHDANRAAFVARVGGRVAGVLDCVRDANEIEFGIVVATEFRRRGIGSALVRRLLAATDRSGTSLIASCELGNTPALGLLRGLGFRRRALRGGTVWLEERSAARDHNETTVA
ncbi:MAG: family acetyltransferase [Candidatus Eremiobacteraeota bacterium]|nr:family acetyltransferase [Candidatus Eremiobacteraeota bacterium]